MGCDVSITLYGREAVSVRHDIASTWRLLSSRAILWGAHRNPYVNHVSGAVVLGVAFIVAAGWMALSGELLAGLLALVAGLLLLVYWRHVLPKALWYSKVETTLDGD